MALFSDIKTNIRANLDDVGITYFSVSDVDEATQDAYDDIALLTQNIVKKVTVNFQSDLNYYDFLALGVTDFMQATAIFSNSTNLWLKDDRAVRDFDGDRPDWENAYGNPVWWAPLAKGSQYTCLYPKQQTASGNMDLYYWAKAPVVVNSDTPLIAIDYANLVEYYATAALLEQAEEFTKAAASWKLYYDNIVEYGERTKNLALSDLLMI